MIVHVINLLMSIILTGSKRYRWRHGEKERERKHFCVQEDNRIINTTILNLPTSTETLT